MHMHMSNVRGYAVLPGVDIRCHAFSHQYRVIKLNSPDEHVHAHVNVHVHVHAHVTRVADVN